MNNICIILVYFGTFNDKFELFKNSCVRNPKIDWIIFTDDESQSDCANVHFVKYTLEEFNRLIKDKIGLPVKITNPYKLCDLKPLYGFLFSEYIENYEYWGYGDPDVIYGNLYTYLENVCYHSYDKINRMGHLCLIKNNDSCNRAFYYESNDTLSYKKVFESIDSNLGFDERDFNRKFEELGFKIYSGMFAADIDSFYIRMRCVDKFTNKYLCKFKNIEYSPTNFTQQIFIVNNGSVYRYYISNGKVGKDEFAYIHYRWSDHICVSDISTNSFLISRKGFFDIDKEKLENKQYLRSLISEYNTFENKLIETIRFIYYYFREYKNNN